MRVPPYNRHVLVSTEPLSNNPNQQQQQTNQNTAPFYKNDPRLRQIPFMTFRPTLNEVKRAHTLLSKIELFSKYFQLCIFATLFNDWFKKTPHILNSQVIIKKIKWFNSIESTGTWDYNKEKKKNKKKKNNSSDPVIQASNKVEEKEVENENEEDAEDDNAEVEQVEIEVPGPEVKTTQDDFIQSLYGDNLKLFNDIYTACFTNNSNKLEQLITGDLNDSTANDLENRSILIEKLLNKRISKENGFTLLHLTSQMGNSECVWKLLLHGANPANPDLTKQHRLPYFVSVNKQTRDTYRRFMNDYPNKYNYTAARITSPLSAEKMNEKLEKEKERKKSAQVKKATWGSVKREENLWTDRNGRKNEIFISNRSAETVISYRQKLFEHSPHW